MINLQSAPCFPILWALQAGRSKLQNATQLSTLDRVLFLWEKRSIEEGAINLLKGKRKKKEISYTLLPHFTSALFLPYSVPLASILEDTDPYEFEAEGFDAYGGSIEKEISKMTGIPEAVLSSLIFKEKRKDSKRVELALARDATPPNPTETKTFETIYPLLKKIRENRKDDFLARLSDS